MADTDDFFEDPLELADILNTALDKGVVVRGDVTLAVADIDLVHLDLGLLLSALETIENKKGGRSQISMAENLGPLILDKPTVDNVRAPLAGALTESATIQPRASRSPAGAQRAPTRGATTGVSIGAPTNASPREKPLEIVARGLPERINADAKGVESGLARLVLTLIEVLRKVLEHQAVRRMEGGKLSGDEVERLGVALLQLDSRMQELKQVFGLSDEDLQIDLGPLGRVR